MDFTFLNADGSVAFYRSDAEQAEWTQEEMSVFATFPTVKNKLIGRGMLLLFRDPATEDWQAFEIRTSKYVEGDHYQQITAESIAIAELTDCHIRDDIEFSNVTAKTALTRILSGTGWAIGANDVTDKSFGDVGRGTVWSAVNTVKQNWNCYIEPRVTVDASGITGKYLDILSPKGTWRGLRLAINKDIADAVVTYDDSELYTALYGYGGSYVEGEGDDAEQKDTVFDDVVWSKTNDHPAKPKGQGYIEDPTKTALYGRNGKPRFGYYQNTDITDPELLLQKTWESLQGCYEPKLSISGTVADLYRLGYADQPLRLHDMAIVEIEPIGLQVYKQVIRLTVNLLDPTGNTPDIGDYIPNIIYINRETEDTATGGGTGRGSGGGGGSRAKQQQDGFKTAIDDNGRNIHLQAAQISTHGDIINQAGLFIDPITGVLIYAENTNNTIGSHLRVTQNMIETEVHDRTQQGHDFESRITQNARNISLEVSDRKSADSKLSGRIDVQADKVSVVVEEKNGQYVVKSAEIVAGINEQTGSYVKIQADKINLSGYVTASQLGATEARIDNLISGSTIFTTLRATNAYLGNANSSNVHIYGQTVRIYQVKDINNTTRYVFGYS